MPIYEYFCEKCEKTHEKIRKMEEKDNPIACPDCEEEMKIKTSVPSSPVFKGSGWTPKHY